MITWSVHPEIFRIGAVGLRWYSLLFAIAFLLGNYFTKKFFKKENVPLEYVDRIFLWMFIGIIAGARLGHTLFYEPETYLSDPLRILKIWEGGLASHGAALGMFVALWGLSKKLKLSFLWLFDRICIPVAFGCALVRLGNLFNSEILGKQTDSAWGFIFVYVDRIPRHPAQLYESIWYFLSGCVLWWMYEKTHVRMKNGVLLGSFFLLMAPGRFLVEFLKENQVATESGLALNFGQLFSIPFFVYGFILVLKGMRQVEEKKSVKRK